MQSCHSIPTKWAGDVAEDMLSTGINVENDGAVEASGADVVRMLDFTRDGGCTITCNEVQEALGQHGSAVTAFLSLR